jgi:dihydroxyacetone kinase-like protein
MDKLSISQFREMLEAALTAVREKEDYFSRLDAVTGDGDHGTAIVTALSAATAASRNSSEFKAMFNDIGFNIMLNTSGSTSTLLGGFFLGMADGSDGTEVDSGELKKMFSSGLAGVVKNTKAKIGDKTMMDALIPAVEAISGCNSHNIKEILQAGATASFSGAVATIPMKANFGRARNYGDRSIGSMDAGASSWATMFGAFSETIK